jgi:phosphate transport system substrate-binding protein
MYNLKTTTGQQIGTQGGAPGLRLDAQTLLKIFSGQIQFWDDPEIAALNPGLALPHSQVTSVVRTDPAGESYILSDYFDILYQAQWAAFTGAMHAGGGPQAIWPSNVGSLSPPYNITQIQQQSGADSLASYVTGNANTIGYLETEYAIHYGLPCAALENPSGNFVQPSETNDAIALTQDQLQPDLEQNLTNVFLNTNPNSYPISAYSYLITQEGQTPAAVGQVLGQFIQYVACRGQQSAGVLGYTPIPPNLVADDYAAINRINGAAPLPPPNASNCDNPYLTGQLALVGEPIQIGTPGASGTTAGGNTTQTTQGGGAGGSSGSAGSAGIGSSASSAATQAAIAAAAANAAKIAAEARSHAASVQVPGVALVAQIGRMLSAPFSTGQIWLWCLLLLAVFAGLPIGIAALSKRLRLRRTGSPPGGSET